MSMTVGCVESTLFKKHKGFSISVLTYENYKCFNIYVHNNDTQYYMKQYDKSWFAKWEKWYPEMLPVSIIKAEQFINLLPLELINVN